MATDDVTYAIQRRRRPWWRFWRKRWQVEQWVPLTSEQTQGVTGGASAFFDRRPLRRFWLRRSARRWADMLELYRVPRGRR